MISLFANKKRAVRPMECVLICALGDPEEGMF